MLRCPLFRYPETLLDDFSLHRVEPRAIDRFIETLNPPLRGRISCIHIGGRNRRRQSHASTAAAVFPSPVGMLSNCGIVSPDVARSHWYAYGPGRPVARSNSCWKLFSDITGTPTAVWPCSEWDHASGRQRVRPSHLAWTRLVRSPGKLLNLCRWTSLPMVPRVQRKYPRRLEGHFNVECVNRVSLENPFRGVALQGSMSRVVDARVPHSELPSPRPPSAAVDKTATVSDRLDSD